MEITYLGHSSFRLKGKNVSVVCDPFDDSVGLKFPKVSADIVTISHLHGDHNKPELVADVKKVISGPGEYEVMGVSMIGIPSFHDNKKGKLRGKNTIFIIEMERIRIAHLGDLGHKLSEKKLQKMGEIDVLMIPVGGHYTIGPDEAVDVAQSIEANITIPMHFQTSGLNSEVFENLVGVDDFLTKVGLPNETMPKLTLKKDLLEMEQRIVVLEKK